MQASLVNDGGSQATPPPRMRMHFGELLARRSVFVVGVVALLACEQEDEPPPVAGPLAGCETRPAGSRWAARNYEKVAEYLGPDGEGIAALWGMVWANPSLYVYDAALGRVVAVTADLRTVGSIGREGRGPGELRRNEDFTQGPGRQWISLSADTLLVYDGRAVSGFDRHEGTFFGFWSSKGVTQRLTESTSRIHLHSEGLVFDDGGYGLPSPTAAGPEFSVRFHSETTRRQLVSLALPSLPGTGRGDFLGPRQAQPLWAAQGGCVVATDGANPWVVRAAVGDSPRDTLHLHLPLREPSGDDDRRLLAMLQRLGSEMRSIPKPTAPSRIRGLVVDPDGYLWLLPVQPDLAVEDGVEVYRIALQFGIAEVDTVPAFPHAFGTPGTFYAVSQALGARPAVVRIDTHTP